MNMEIAKIEDNFYTIQYIKTQQGERNIKAFTQFPKDT